MDKVTVKGAQAFNRPASMSLEAAAYIADFGIAACCFVGTLKFIPISSSPSWSWLFILLIETASLWLLQKFIFGKTIGEVIWNLQSSEPIQFASRENFGRKLFQLEYFTRPFLTFGILLTVIPWIGGATLLARHFSHHPVFEAIDGWEISAFLPENLDQTETTATGPSATGESWVTLPVFYTLGAWPRTFRGNPIFYSIPYETAPPHRFIGKILAKWENDQIQVTFEGPKTPQLLLEKAVSRDDLRSCFRATLVRHSLWECLQFREIAMKRHLTEMSALLDGNIEWKTRWFSVSNPALPAQERIEGFSILAKNKDKIQQRFVLVTGKGTHQTVIVDVPLNKEATGFDTSTYALKLVENAIGSLRINDSLSNGRAWVDQQLEAMKLPTPTEVKNDPQLLHRLAAAQALIVAKLSVDMTTFLSYNTLADLSLFLQLYAADKQNPQMGALGRQMVLTAYRFGQDVLDADPKRQAEKNGQWSHLQQTFLESKKY